MARTLYRANMQYKCVTSRWTLELRETIALYWEMLWNLVSFVFFKRKLELRLMLLGLHDYTILCRQSLNIELNTVGMYSISKPKSHEKFYVFFLIAHNQKKINKHRCCSNSIANQFLTKEVNIVGGAKRYHGNWKKKSKQFANCICLFLNDAHLPVRLFSSDLVHELNFAFPKWKQWEYFYCFQYREFLWHYSEF